jgi:hypothetical protein
MRPCIIPSELNAVFEACSSQAAGISVSFLGSNFKVQAAGIPSMHASYEAELLDLLGGEYGGSCRVVDMLFPSPNLVDLMHQGIEKQRIQSSDRTTN